MSASIPAGSLGDPELDGLLRRALAAYDALTPEQRAAHDEAQRQSFGRGNNWGDEGTRCVRAPDSPRTRETPLDARLAEVRQRIRSYAGGDRPPSPPAYLLAEERALEEGVAACREATRLPCGHSIDDLAKPAVGATVCRACLVAGEPLAPTLEAELRTAREHLVERDDQIASLRRRLAAQNADTIARALGEAKR